MNTHAARLAVAALALSTSSALAQDPAAVGPDIYKCKFENERARLCEVTFKPGAKIARHSHPDHLVYVLQPGRLRVTGADGRSHDVEFKAGQAIWSDAEAHSAVNPGPAEVRGIIVELKNPEPARRAVRPPDGAMNHRPPKD